MLFLLIEGDLQATSEWFSRILKTAIQNFVEYMSKIFSDCSLRREDTSKFIKRPSTTINVFILTMSSKAI